MFGMGSSASRGEEINQPPMLELMVMKGGKLQNPKLDLKSLPPISVTPISGLPLCNIGKRNWGLELSFNF